MDVDQVALQLDEVQLNAMTCGLGSPVVLLHGFPEFSYSWRSQIPALAAAGFRAIAPDLRGYHRSDKPLGIRAYAVDRLIADVATLIERHAGGRTFVVGHDWGGVIAWRLAALRPDLVRKLVVLNAPHPAAWRRVLMNNFGQWLRSAYVLFFQVPGLPQAVLQAGDFWLIERTLRRQLQNRRAFSQEDIARYKEALRQPGALTAALNYYRAALRHPGTLFQSPQCSDVPTLLIWGERDPYLSADLTKGLGRWVKNLQVVRLKGVSHWVQNDRPDEVNRLLIEFFTTREPA